MADGSWYLGKPTAWHLPPGADAVDLKAIFDAAPMTRRDLEFESDEDRQKFNAQFGTG